MKIVLTGGGTAGHVTPTLALINDLKKNFDEIHYIGSNGIEKELVKNYKEIIYHEIPCVKLERRFTFKNLLIPFKLTSSIIKAKKIIEQIKPDIVFSKGGFVALPVVYAAALKKIPIVAHESDITMGLANKLIYKKCNKMCFSFSTLIDKYDKKGIYTGTPIRKELKINSHDLKEQLKLNKTKPTILFFGGSLGAKAINDCVFDSINQLTKKYNIIHIVGKGNKKDITQNGYVQIEYTNTIGDYFKTCDIAVCRAGSNSIFELLYLKKPMLLIPLPLDVSRGDQIKNARYFEEKGFAKVLPQENLNTKTLLSNIDSLIMDKNNYVQNMSKSNVTDGTNNVLKVIYDTLKNEQ